MSKKRGRPVTHADLPKEIRDNINESNLPDNVLEAIKQSVKVDTSTEEVSDIDDCLMDHKPKRQVGKHPITGEIVYK